MSDGYYMKRMFLPVGQGAFYCEQFFSPDSSEPFTVVFDCGTLPVVGMKKRIAQTVPMVFKQSKTIHAVYLSHLHEDHDNGLEELQNKHHIRIEQIYYPAIGKDVHKLMDMWYQATNRQDSFECELCMNQPTESSRFPGTRLIPIHSALPPKDPTIDDGVPPGLHVVSLGDIVNTDTNNEWITRKNPFVGWEFRAFNYRQDDLIKKLRRYLKSVFASTV